MGPELLKSRIPDDLVDTNNFDLFSEFSKNHYLSIQMDRICINLNENMDFLAAHFLHVFFSQKLLNYKRAQHGAHRGTIRHKGHNRAHQCKIGHNPP